ncbi:MULTISPECIES: amidase [Paenochrobactrum]|uniref:amidase n=1 Tax=Paenochrobactrum pullorum TaxID=1324351 RepID=UPI0035BC8B0E
MRKTISEALAELSSGKSTSTELTQLAISRILDPSGEGSRAFIGGVRASAIAQAHAADRTDMSKYSRTLAGIPLSIKDLFNVRGDITRAGSRVLSEHVADDDCTVTQRLLSAGAVLIGRTNMSEFAYTGIGINPHYGTPLNPWDRATGRIPGGSSSGAAVSVADGMCIAAIGTDTGGSCRIPAALCGLVGFKPSAGTISSNGIVPLSPSLDSIGSIANSVECCAILDQVLRGEKISSLHTASVSGLRVGVPANYMLDDLDDEVAAAFSQALEQLSASGAVISKVHFKSLSRLGEMISNGGIVAAEAYAWHRDLLAKQANLYDPLIRKRIEAGKSITKIEYSKLLLKREELSLLFADESSEFDVLAMPTVPIVAPAIMTLADEDEYYRINKLLLRNTSPANMFGSGAISVPIHSSEKAPVGLMLMGHRNADRRLFEIAQGVSNMCAHYVM